MMSLEGNNVRVISGCPREPCVFCNSYENNELKYGKIYQYEHIFTHYYCLLLSSNMAQLGEDEEGIFGFLVEDILKELKRGGRLFCSYCKRRGATLGCCNRKCRKVFHLPCGMKENSHHQFYGEFKSYCIAHRPKLPIDNIPIKFDGQQVITCVICYDNIDNCKDLFNILWAPCCKKSSLFHRDCVQRLALSAGYFFKCPLCNNKKQFQQSMLDCGIFIPHQDASWELEPNAFQELLYRHNKCDVTKCLCPHGKDYSTNNNSKHDNKNLINDKRWELLLCCTCGSQGTHRQCSRLMRDFSIWNCSECSSIIEKSKNNSITSTTLEEEEEVINGNDNDDDSDHFSSDSDSDISLGVENSYQHLLNTSDNLPALKPGPRSAKLKQLQSNQHKTNVNNLSKAIDSAISSSSSFLSSPSTVSSSSSSTLSPPYKSIPTLQQNGSNQIVIDDDDDDIIIDDDQNTPVNNHQENKDAVSSIKIVNVTSLKAKDLEVSLINLDSDNENISLDCANRFIDKRKADSPLIVSQIVAKIVDNISFEGQMCPKKPRLDEYTCNIKVNNLYFTTKRIPIENNNRYKGPVLRYAIAPKSIPMLKPSNNKRNNNNNNNNTNNNNNNNNNKTNGISNSDIVNVDDNDFIEPIDSIINSHTTNPSNYDGDAGTCPATDVHVEQSSEDKGWEANSSDTTNCSGRRRSYSYQRFKDSIIANTNTSNSTNTSTCQFNNTSESTTRSYFNRLMAKPILINDLKFRIDSNNTLLMSVNDGFTIKITDNISGQQNKYPINHNNNNDLNGFSQTRGSILLKNIEDLNDINLNNNSDNSYNYNDNICSTTSDVKNFVKSNNYKSKNFMKFIQCELLKNNNENDATKENLVPDIRQHDNIFINSDSHNNINKNYNILINNNIGSNDNDPGTSNNIINNQNHNDDKKKIIENYYFNNHMRQEINNLSSSNELNENVNLNFKISVSIDLQKIQSLIDNNPKLFFNKKSLFKFNSMNNINSTSSCNSTNNNINNNLKLSKRSKSCDNYTTKTFHNYYNEISMKNLGNILIKRNKKQFYSNDTNHHIR